MIIVRLRGGLGNQFFEYAFARYLSKKHNTDLWINTSFYTSTEFPTRRRFELTHFNICCKQICDDHWQNELVKSNVGLKYVRDNDYAGSPEDFERIVELGDYLILEGFWSGYTGYLFDKGFGSLIRREITLKNEIEDHAFKSLKEKIERSVNSVSVHIRRGDYRDAQHLFVLCGEDYYQRAFDLILRKTSAPEYFVFSDEIEWVEDNFRFSQDVKFVKTGTTISDFELMRRCRHNIIANSTYSWWAAYLNENKDKTVIVPAKYYEYELWQTQHEAGDAYIPPMWLRV